MVSSVYLGALRYGYNKIGQLSTIFITLTIFFTIMAKQSAKKSAKTRNKDAKTAANTESPKITRAQEVMFVEQAKAIVWKESAPWASKIGSRPAIPAKSKVLCYLLKERLGMSYRAITTHLEKRRNLLKIMELKHAPSKSVIADIPQKLPSGYAEKINKKIERALKKAGA